VSTEKRRRAAAALIRRGVAVIPVPAGEKNPGRNGWEALRITEDEVPNYWTNGQNVGLLCGEPSGGRVDVDLDPDEAVRIAGRFLTPTLTSGRESRPHSHWWYVSASAESCDWKDTDGSKLVELRSTGRQTLVSPSLHPDGDEYLWHAETGLKMAEIGASELSRRLRELATAVLIARHLPPRRTGTEGGGRHDYALALSGFLLRPGRLGEALTLNVLKAAWDAKGWPGEKAKQEAYRDLEGIVSDTAENLRAGEPVVGGPTLEEYAPGMVRLLCRWWGWERKPKTEDKPEEKEERRNQADRLISYALEDVQELFVDQHGAPHGLIDGEPVPLTSRCYSWLRRLMWEEEGRSVSGEYLKMAAGTLSAHAEFSGESMELHTRAAWREGILYYELRAGKVVRVGPGGWTFEANPPVLFRRYVNLKALPDPETGGSLDVLDGLVNLKSERDRRLFKAYLVTLPLEHVGRPIFNASGAMGSGKTTIQRLIKRLLDPTAPETVRFDPRDFLQKAMHAYIVMLDNQNTIPEWAADTLCRLVTGEADSKRRLYTDDEDFIIELRRAALLNGINVPTDRGDVLDRSLVVELERISDGDRKTEEQLWERFEEEHPKLFGALFDILSRAIALKPSLKLSRRPRLADWGEYAAAVYEVMGWGSETFLNDWDEVVKVQNQATLDGSPVAQAIIKLMEEHEECSATSSKMHALLKEIAEAQGVDVARDKAWPKSARWLWRRIKEVLPLLVAAGIEASRGRHESAKQITLRKIPTNDGSDGSVGESRTDKGQTHADTAEDDGRSNGSGDANGMPDGSEKPPSNAASANNAYTANRSGTSWKNDPMRHYGRKGGAA
jgi:Bifunctional DNA primase/polymerase, N-terminal